MFFHVLSCSFLLVHVRSCSFMFVHFRSFSFIFFHFLSFSFIFFLFFSFSFSLSFIVFHILSFFHFLSFSFIFSHFLLFYFIFFVFVGCSKSVFFGASISLRFLLTVLIRVHLHVEKKNNTAQAPRADADHVSTVESTSLHNTGRTHNHVTSRQ